MLEAAGAQEGAGGGGVQGSRLGKRPGAEWYRGDGWDGERGVAVKLAWLRNGVYLLRKRRLESLA